MIKNEKNSQLNLKAIYKGNERLFLMKKSDKFSDFVEKVEKEFKIIEEKDNWRLRLYSFYEDFMQDSYGGRENMVKITFLFEFCAKIGKKMKIDKKTEKLKKT